MKRKAAFKIVFIYAVFMLFFCMFSEGESVYAADFETADIKEKYEQNTVNLRKNVFRLYNRKTGEYLYTSDIEENNKIAEDSEWMSEGIVWSFDEGKGTPVYRLYSEKKGHRYTESFDECIWMKENGWKYEGVCWCIDSQSEGTFHTMINPYAESERDKYVYTQSSAEIDMLTRLGWTNLPGVYYIEIQEDRDTYNSRTVDYYLGGKGSVVKYLNSNKSKFLGIDYDDNNEVYYYNFDAPKEKMQCAQFVSIVMNNCGCNLNKLTSESGGDPSQASAWIYFAKNGQKTL